MLIPFVLTKSMKLPIALESKSALTECTLLVSVVLISIRRIINVPQALRVLAESCLGNLLSHFGLQGWTILSGAEGERESTSIGSQISVLTSSMSNTANLLTSGDQVHFSLAALSKILLWGRANFLFLYCILQGH